MSGYLHQYKRWLKMITNISAAALAPISLRTALMPVSLQTVWSLYNLPCLLKPHHRISSVQYDMAPPNKLSMETE